MMSRATDRINLAGGTPFRPPLLMAALLAACALASPLVHAQPAAAATGLNLPLVESGYEPPAGLELVAARGTGRTTGHIATLTVRNDSDQAVDLPPAMFYIPSSGQHQGYVGRPVARQAVPAGATQDVPIEGYCTDVRRPPVAQGESLPPPGDWIVSTGESGPIEIAAVDTPASPGLALVPGTDTPLPRAISVDDEPMLAVPLLFAAISEIEQATADLQESGKLVTPFSSNRDREREAVIQQTFWIFAAELENEEPYTQAEFTERLEAQFESSTGVPIAEAPEQDQQQLAQGAQDFWGSFELVGEAAKVLAKPHGSAEGATLEPKKGPLAGAAGKPPAEAVPPKCTVEETIEHSPPVVQVQVGEDYGNEEDREKIKEGIRESVESEEIAYFTSTRPSTAYSIWRADVIGGISSAYAREVSLAANEQGQVWSTEPLSATADGNGVHTITFTHGPECRAVVAGSAGLWLKASSEAFDTLEGSVEYSGAADAVKEVREGQLNKKLPPGLRGGLQAGVEATTVSSSNSQAAASGSATLLVGDDRDSGTAASRVIYKLDNKGDETIIGGGVTVESIRASDRKPDSLTSRIDATVTMDAAAKGDGLAKARLESLYGTILIGVCECANAPPIHKVIANHGRFLSTPAAKTVYERANLEMKSAVDILDHQIGIGAQATDGESLQRRAEAELEEWMKKVVGDYFEPEGEKSEGG